MDFTLNKYSELLSFLKSYDYEIIPYVDYLQRKPDGRFVIMRHDVDLKPQNSFAIAKIEAKYGARSSYYFRAVPKSWDEVIIHKIAQMGHEIGYHYESLTTCNGDVDKAYDDFVKNLKKLCKIVPVNTICMHGSPRSPYDSKDIWRKFDYEELGIKGEPYLSTDFSEVFYLTDTGRRWDGYKVSVRDKIEKYQDCWNRQGLVFHTTDDIIRSIRDNHFPDRAMITTHPQRWNNFGMRWLEEVIMQNLKNVVKAAIVRS